MRTIDATLTAALAAGSGSPYLMGYVGDSLGNVTKSHPVIAYKLTGTSLEFEWAFTDNALTEQSHLWLTRGLTIAGVNYTLSTGRFFIHSQHFSPGRCTLKGSLWPKQYYSAAANNTYQAVIQAFCSAFGKTAVFRNTAAAWLAYTFFPAGKFLILNDANHFMNLLAQKYLIFACDNGSEEVLFYDCGGSLSGAADLSITPTNSFYKEFSTLRARQFIWRDEIGSVHTLGAATDPIHNLGYLESTASAPARQTAPLTYQIRTRPDLRALDGDIVALVAMSATSKLFALVSEEYAAPDRSHAHPRWETIIDSNPVFGNTAGGAMPSTIERVSNYTPLNTSMFGGILSSSHNNLQAAMDAIDDHQHKQSDVFSAHANFATVPASSTYYMSPGATWLQAGEAQVAYPKAATLKNLYFNIASTQPASGSLVVTIRKNGVDQALTITIPAGSAAGSYSDTTHTVTIAAGDRIGFKIVNNATAPSAQVTSTSFELEYNTH